MNASAVLVGALCIAVSTTSWAQGANTTNADSARASMGRTSRPLCFGVSFDRGCRVMVQYEAGLRARAAGGLPVPRDMSFAGPSTWDWFLGGGLMIPVAAGRAVGVIYQAGTEGPVHSLGVRYARSLGGASRLDVTGGATYYSTSAGGGTTAPHSASSRGVFGEAALHANDYATVLAREESFFGTRDLAPRSRLLVGARLERGPAVVTTAVAVVLIGALIASWAGEDW